MPQDNNTLPLCVDLDGTLIYSDLFFESLSMLLKSKPLLVFLLPFWLLRGRARLKAEVARRALPDIGLLPYNHALLEWLREERRKGRRVVLATASHDTPARKIAEHLGIFDEIAASDETHNLKGRAKAAELCKRFGAKGFVYAGDSRADLAVWREAAAALVVGGADLARRAAVCCPVERSFPAPARTWWRHLPAQLRIQQWVKNLLVFLPLLAAHKAHEPAALFQACAAFLAFSLTASGAYLLNDLLDLDADRRHPRKRGRPFAAGLIPLSTGFILVFLIPAAGLLTALFLHPLFAVTLLLYYLLTLAYSFYLKALLLVDVVCLALLYTQRIIGGAAAVQVTLSHWMLAFSVFLFFSLAVVKRYSELNLSKQHGRQRAKGRAYTIDDLPILAAVGVSSGHIAVLVTALYINSPEVRVLYAAPEWLWLVGLLLLYWINRVWLLARRGVIPDDPLLFAVRDKISYIIAALGALLIAAASFT